MESVWLLLGGGRDAVRRPGLGFLETSRFAATSLDFWGLEKLGFPWILSSESILINGLHGETAQRFFRGAFFRSVRRAEREHAVEAMRKSRFVHGTSLQQFLFFCN